MSSVLGGIASTLSYYTGYDFTGSAASSSSSSSPQPAFASTFPTLSHHGSAGTADYSGMAADPSTLSDDVDDDNITALYSSAPNDDEYFNLGGSSFPLLPHAPHMVDAFEGEDSDDDEDDGRSVSSASSTSEQKQSIVSASRSSHHFSSVLNNPLASYGDFEEEDMLPFSPAYIPALTDSAIDAAQVRRHIAAIGNIDAYRENHPDALQSIPAVSSHSNTEPLSSPIASVSPSLLTPFASSTLPRAFTFIRRRSSHSSSAAGTPASRVRHRRAVSQVSLQAAAAKAKAEEEQIVARELADCLSTVPAPFFSASYDLLQQPFVLELLSTISLPASSSASQKQHTAASLALQSALSGHLDQVELSLFRAINARSHQFFSVMSRVEALKLEIAECVDSIQSVQVALRYVDEHLIAGGLQVVEQHVRRSNVTTLCAKLELMQMCSRTQATVQLLLSTGDYGSSLMLIQQTRAVLASDLSGVTSMRNVERKLMEQVKMIEKLMESEMMLILTQAEDADDGRRAGEEKDGRDRRRGEVQHIRRELSEDEKERLSPILENLVKLGALPAAIADYRRELAACIKQRLTDLVYAHIDAVVNDELEDTGQQQQTAATSAGNAGTAPSSAAASASSSSSSPSSSSASSPTASSPAASSVSVTHPHASVSAAAGHSSPPSEAVASSGDASARSQSPIADSSAHSAPPPPSSSPLPSAPSSDTRSSSPTPGTAAFSAAPSAAPLAHPIPAAASSPALTPTTSAPAAAASSTITLRLQSLSHRQFMDFLSPLFSALMDPIYRAASVRTLLAAVLAALDRELDVTASVTPAASSSANSRLLATLSQRKAEYASSLPLLSELLVSSSELLHLRIAKLLSRRQALHAALPLPSFRELLETVLSFLQQSEALCGRQFYGLRGALLGQAKAFVAVFHAASMREMAETLEKEKWQRIDVDYQYQEIIDSGFVRQRRPGSEAEEESKMTGKGGGGSQSEDERKEARNGTHTAVKTERKVLFVPIPKASSSSGSSSPSSAALTGGGSGSNFLKFPVVKSVLTLLTLITQYVELSSQLPALTLDTLNRLLELLTLFNSRTCQLVLGAGAMHLAGLRSITATHLALSSQAIALLSSQVDGLKRLFASRLSVKQHVFLPAFDRVKLDCDEHVLQVREKLIGIMRDLIDSMMRKMQQQLSLSDRERREAAGEQDEEEEDDVVSPAVRLLMKQTCSLHRALTDLLSVRERNIIFQQIGASLVAGFVQVSRRVETETAAAGAGRGAERARVMLQGNGLHIMMRMRTLTGVDDNVMLQLKEFVEQLKVEQQLQQQPAGAG